MSYPIRILLVEDNSADADLLVQKLTDYQFDVSWQCVQTEDDYLNHLEPGLDLILSDFQMPQFTAFRALELLKEKGYEIPFIIISGSIGEEKAVELMKQGASDYLLKDRLGRLGSAVRHALDQNRLRQECQSAKEALLEGERKFRALFDAASDPIYMIQDGLFVDCNVKGRNIYGRSHEEIIGHSPVEFAPPIQPDGRPTQEKAIEIITAALAGEPQFFEWQSIHANGDSVYSEISLNRLELGGKVMLQAIARDITERKRTAERLEEQAALLDKAQDAIIVRDLRGGIVFWNKGAERMYGWTPEEAVGRNIGTLIYQDVRKFNDINDRMLDQGEWFGEVQHVTKNQHDLTVQAHFTLVRDEHGYPKSVLTINTDITEQKKIEAQFMRAQRMESIGTLAGGIAHDLNNILTPIMMSIGVLKLKLKMSDAKTRHILDSIEKSAKRGADIVRQVLSFARGVESEIQPKHLLRDLKTIVKDTFPKNIHLKIDLPEEPWTILGDSTQLHQILLNLCVNARDAMPAGGMLTITVENSELPEDSPSLPMLGKPGEYVVLTVTDSGIGIDSEVLDKIFEPFFTTKEVGKGTGLGLSTVMAIVKSHEGFINVYSEPNKGTAFRIYLPRAAGHGEARRHSAEFSNLTRGHGETILVVDDEASIREVTSHSLEAFGYRALTAHNGVEALAIYKKHPEISAVLTDMAMPVMDGPTTIRALLKLNPDLKIIASSGLRTNESIALTPEAGIRHFLPKPYTAEALLEMLQPMLDEP
jgi:PAS domain S-box-containing protein